MSGTPNLAFDFGYTGTGSLGDLVWYDLDKSGTQNNGEPGIGGVRVTLVGAGADGLFGTADDLNYGSQTTTAAGAYLFPNLPAGQYRVAVDPTTLPAGVTLNTYDLDSGTVNANSTADTPLTAGQNLVTADFGYTGTGSIGDRVFFDTNADGLQTVGEPGIPGVPVTLVWFGPDGKVGGGDDVTESTVTGSNGFYTFGTLPPGAFRVTVGTPLGTVLSSAPDGVLDNTTLVPLASGQAVVTADFGFKGRSALSGNVFVDVDGSNTLTEADTPINGVTLTLTGTDAFGNPVTATTTTTAGAYSFPNLAPGTYAVTETQPAGYGNGPTLRGTVNTTPTGTVGTDTVTGITLAAGQTGIDYNFGEVVGAISGRVVYDRNRDGVLAPAPTESGIGGVTVTLFDATGKSITTAVTASDGTYQFTGLTGGTYTVTETQPVGYADTPTGPFAPNTRTVTLPAGGAVPGQDFGEVLGSLSGRVVVDTATPDTPIAGVTITLINPTTGTTATTTTAADGTYTFTDLLAGSYRVVETQPPAYLDGPDTPGTFGGTLVPTDTIDAIPVPAGGIGTAYNFRELVSQTVVGTVYLDRNQDGTQTTNEPGIPGVTVELVNSAGTVVSTTTTNKVGGFVFTNVPPGTYTVRETQPTGYGNPPIGPDATNTRPVTVTPTTPGSANFADTLATLSGKVTVDTGAPIAGVTITLINPTTGTTATTTTAADGTYTFTDLLAGSYRVVETQPPAYLDGPDTPGTFGGTLVPTDTIDAITVPAGGTGPGYDFRELTPQSVTGVVYLDRNQDGTQTPGEPGIPGVTVELVNSTGTVVGTTTTNSTGAYQFVNVPSGTYIVRETNNTGYADSPAGPDRTNTRPVTVTPTIPGVANFADALGTVTGTVYLDTNRDGTRTPGEPGIPGVTITLTNPTTGATITTTTTAADGSYSFTDLVAGTYKLTETQPAGVNQGTNTAGPAGGTVVAVDMISAVPVTPPGTSPGNNFGELPYPDVTGTVFVDRNKNGVKDPAEPGIPGVVIQLLDPTGRIVGTATTDPSGNYRISNVPPGNYTVREIQPAGYANTPTGPNQANDRPLTVGTGGVTATQFGEVLSSLTGIVYRDFNLDGTRTPTGANPDTGIPGVVVTLVNDAGIVVGTTTTDAAGVYTFTDLPAGTYTVIETQPPLPTTLTNGFYDGLDTIGSPGWHVAGEEPDPGGCGCRGGWGELQLRRIAAGRPVWVCLPRPKPQRDQGRRRTWYCECGCDDHRDRVCGDAVRPAAGGHRCAR